MRITEKRRKTIEFMVPSKQCWDDGIYCSVILERAFGSVDVMVAP